MVLKYLGVLVHWTKIASTMKGLKISLKIILNIVVEFLASGTIYFTYIVPAGI